jgi:hypothetical protein
MNLWEFLLQARMVLQGAGAEFAMPLLVSSPCWKLPVLKFCSAFDNVSKIEAEIELTKPCFSACFFVTLTFFSFSCCLLSSSFCR